ncbi:MAG: polymer-forming cytoskeletal protein [Candidatus Obscuribacterales bacterium]|nr:polymer-forming cytoskeletal protein [Steroidobacteraceae bacterium]
MSNPYDTAAERMSILPPSMRFKGELSADEDLLIQGTIEGTIHHTQRVTIGKEGKIKANISANIIKVEGTVEGDLQAEHSVHVNQSGNLRGNIRAPSVCLVEGSHFNGAVDMDPKRPGQAHSEHGTGRVAAKAKPSASGI